MCRRAFDAGLKNIPARFVSGPFAPPPSMAAQSEENKPLPPSSDVWELVERLRRLGQRREMEGIYTDQNICEAAAAKLQETEAELTKLRDQLAEAKEALEPFAEHARRNANAMLCVPVA